MKILTKNFVFNKTHILTELEQIMSGVYLLPKILSKEQINRLLTLKGMNNHHDDEEGHHVYQDKPYKLPWVSELIWLQASKINFGSLSPCGVDEKMKLYRLKQGAGIVPRHRDENFAGPNQSIALYSILIYLNENYVGGETVFNGITAAPHISAGGGLLFRHNILHEGLVVHGGEKYVLKTDLFFQITKNNE